MTPAVTVLVGGRQPWHDALLAALGPDGRIADGPGDGPGLVLDLRVPARPARGHWAFEVGLGGFAGLDAPGSRELHAGLRTCDVRLVRRCDGDAVQVLLEGRLPLVGDTPAQVAEGLLARLADWPAWALAHADGGAPVPRRPERPLPRGSVARSLCRHLRRRRRELLLRERWTLGLLRGATAADLVAGRPLPPPVWAPERVDGYLADPFALAAPGEVLAELYPLRGGPAALVELRWDADGRAPRVLGPGPGSSGHLSYPSAFEHDGTQWCVPESAAEGRVALWRRDPGGWARVRTLLDVPAVDPDLVLHEGRWWLLYALEGERRNEELHLAWADRLDGPFTPHPANPVVRDVTAARGAGRPFVVDGRLYRPAQDCSDAYGGALAVVEVTALSTARYAQQVVRRLCPLPPYPAGLHTLNVTPAGLLVDGKREELSLPHVLAKAGRRLRG
ncbi:MAG: glucosamine inositolphosphorylceramide transferase family protein [Mycobacteriales bacterium]